jgi:hypothetical protein
MQELAATLDTDGVSWYDKTAQAFSVFLPVKSVGVMGDGRTYEYVVSLRAVQTTDFMTADWAPLPHALLAKVSNRIINEVRGINRVVYDIEQTACDHRGSGKKLNKKSIIKQFHKALESITPLGCVSHPSLQCPAKVHARSRDPGLFSRQIHSPMVLVVCCDIDVFIGI